MTTLAVAGNGAIVPLVEGHAATRERWTVDVTVDDLESLFFYTLANIVVVCDDVWMEESASIPVKVGGAVKRLNKLEVLWDVLWMRYGAIFAKTTRISSISEKLSIGGEGPRRFMCCECHIKRSRLSASGSVTLGCFANAKLAGPYEQAWLTSVCSAVAENDVRYMCGVFWRGKEETGSLTSRGFAACVWRCMGMIQR